MILAHNLDMPRMRVVQRGKYLANEQLKRFREQAGLSQRHLGELIGRDQSVIARMESGEIRTTADMADSLAPHLGVDPRDLFPRAAGSPRAADGGGIDREVMARAIAVARRLESDSDAVASEIISLWYDLLARERDGHPISDNEPTLRSLELFVRRLRGIPPP
jgi:transcriptional regulator with XRE-family HTH domain